jgi:hypothetical protein
MMSNTIQQYFPDPLRVEPVLGGNWRNWRLISRFRYLPGPGFKRISVPAGFVTDLTSIPWFLRSLIPVWGRHGPAAVIHDYLYAVSAGKLYADWMFLRALKQSGCCAAKRWAMFLGVLCFGWFAYWNHKRKNKKETRYV